MKTDLLTPDKDPMGKAIHDYFHQASRRAVAGIFFSVR